MEKEQLKGPFKFILHDHYFQQSPEGVVMKDVFQFQSPFGWLGKLVDHYILTKYLTGFLLHRNKLIKEYAENTKLAAQVLR
jgi:ligand-binding SRPBCC domain-containing protein